MSAPGSLHVAVIGGGWAGCTAAVSLARAGHRVTLFEAAPTLGGRARRVALDNLPLDNGEHLLLGAYTETWLLWYGLLFMAIVIWKPEGLAGLWQSWRARQRSAAATFTTRQAL